MNVTAHPAFAEQWYYTIELGEDIFTNGAEHQNVVLTRRLLSGIDVAGRRCLDLGTQEGMIPVLLSRRGSGAIVATDILDRQARIDLVRSALDVSFDYRPRRDLTRLRDELGRDAPYDLVICSGVLYHVSDPYAWIGLAASACASGGLVLIETAAWIDETCALLYNGEGAIYDDSNTYFFPTPAFLEAALRVFALTPIGVVRRRIDEIAGKSIARIGIVARKGAAPSPWVSRVQSSWDTAIYARSQTLVEPVRFSGERMIDTLYHALLESELPAAANYSPTLRLSDTF